MRRAALSPSENRPHLLAALDKVSLSHPVGCEFCGIARCHRAAIEGRSGTTMQLFAGSTLVVIDELGHLSLLAEAASALFQVLPPIFEDQPWSPPTVTSARG